MARSKSVWEKSGISIWRIIGAVISLIILIARWLNFANFVIGRSLLLAFPVWDVSYKRC